MKLVINTPFELDVELVDHKPNYLKVKSNWVTGQTIDVDETEMIHLLGFLNFSSQQFNHSTIKKVDELTLSWG